MRDNKRIIAVIPARGGSKTVPRKNIKILNGKPLMAWSIETAQASPCIDRVIVSTEDQQIADVARQYGAEVMSRPAHLSQDDSLPIHVVQDLIIRLRNEGESAPYMVYLEPTSPLRTSADIDRCLQLLSNECNSYRSVATFSEADLHPHRAWRIENDQPHMFIPDANPWLPRQQLPQAYQLNGAVYGFLVDDMLKENTTFLTHHPGAVLMPKERSIDIDDELDFIMAEALFKKRDKRKSSKANPLGKER